MTCRLLRSPRLWFTALSLWALGSAMSAPCLAAAHSGETWSVQGRTYSNVRVREITPATVTIFHRGGITQLELAVLPPELQAQLGFDAEQAAAWRDAAERDLAATRQVQQQVEGQRRVLASALVAERARADEPRALLDPVNLYGEVDLRPIFRSHGLIMKDQGRRPSCAVFAVVGALEYELARRHRRVEPLSEEYLIWAVHQLQPGLPLDDGYHFEEVVSALQTHGVARQATMPNTYGKKVSEIQPSPIALGEAGALRTAVPVWFRREDPKLLERLVDTLNRGTPIVVGLQWPHWRTLEHNPLLRDQQPLPDAGHAVTLVGYECKDGNPENLVFTFRNSYGIRWGVGGCGFVAQRYLREHLITAFHLSLPSEPAVVAGTP